MSSVSRYEASVYTLPSLPPAIALPQLSPVWVAHRDGHSGKNNAYKSQSFICLSTGEDVEIGGGVHIDNQQLVGPNVVKSAQQRALQYVAEPTPAILHRWDS